MPAVLSSMALKIVADTRDAETGLKRVQGQTRAAERSMDGGSTAAGGLALNLTRVAKMATGVGVALAGFQGVQEIYRLGKQVVEMGFSFNSLKEQAGIAFTTMLGGAEKAGRMIEQLTRFAAKTPFELESLLPQTQKLVAFGFAAQKVIPMLKSIGNAVAGLGGGQDMIGRITLALGQMQAKGVASAQEMMQLTEAGIPAWKFLADVLGTDVAGAMKAVERRTVEAGTVIEAVLGGMDKDFAGMMEKQANTMQGAWSTIKDTAKQIAGDITKPAFDALEALMIDFATNKLPEWQRQIQAAQAKGAERKQLQLIAKTVEPAADALNMREFELEGVREAIADITEIIAAGEDPTGYWVRELEKLNAQLVISEKAALDAAEAYRIAQIEAGFLTQSTAAVDTWAMGGTRNVGVPYSTGRTWMEDTERLNYDARLEAERRAQIQINILHEQQAQTYGRALERAIENAHNAMKGKIEGIVNDAIRASKGLADLIGDIFSPGANGPFENIFRAQAVAVGGNDNEWANVLGLDQESAKRIVQDFQKGLFTPEVISLIDVGGLVEQAKGLTAAEKSKEAFVENIAGMAGVEAGAVYEALGLPDPKAGEKAGADLAAAFKSGAGEEDTGKELVGQIIASTNAAIKDREEDIKNSGKSFMRSYVAGAMEGAGELRGALIDMLLPGLLAAIDWSNVRRGGATP